MVVHITQDLMMSSNASAAARAAGYKFKFVASWERAAHFISENEVKYLIVDLQTVGLDVTELSQGLAQIDESDRPQTIVYAQHVEHDLLEAAHAAGFDQVLTRGQAHQGMSKLLKSNLAG